MANRFDLSTYRDPRASLRAERTRLRDRDADEASELMQLAYARARTVLEDAEREAEEMVEAARATGRGIVADAEREAAALRRKAERQREQARTILRDAKQLVARAEARVVPPPSGELERADATPIDLNEATSEDLRVIGLSLTQARRVVARRTSEGPYASVEQLAELPGMPAALLGRVRGRLRV